MPEFRRVTGLSFPAASSAMELPIAIRVAREATGKRRNRPFVYDRHPSILSEGTALATD